MGIFEALIFCAVLIFSTFIFMTTDKKFKIIKAATEQQIVVPCFQAILHVYT